MSATLLQRDAMRAEPADPSTSALETDAALLQRYLSSRDRTAMDQFFQRHVGSAYRVALCIVGNSDQAEEAVQAAFVQILALKAVPANPAGWVAGVVINTCRMAVREEKRRRQREETAAMNSIHTGAAAPDAEKSELAAAAIRGVKNLPEHYRLPVWLHFLEQMSFAEIAAALSLSEGTVREQARRGLAHLRESLLAGGFMVAAIGLPELLNAAPLTPPPATLAAALKSLAASAAPHGAATTVPAMAAKAGAFSTVKLGAIAAFAVAGAAIAAHFSPTLRAGGRHETRADDAPPPVAAPVQPIQPIQPGPVTVAAPKVATRDELLSKKLDVAYRRDFLIEVLRDLNDRTGIHCVCPRPIEALPQFHFTFEKKNATVKEVLEKLAAGGELQLEFHDNTAVFWKKADDAVLAELTQQLKTPAAKSAVDALGTLADPRIFPLLFEAFGDTHISDDIEIALGNNHRDTLRYAPQLDTLSERLVTRFNDPKYEFSGWTSLCEGSRDPRLVAPLMKLARDPAVYDIRRRLATECVANMGATDSIPILIQALRGAEKNEGISAMWALAETHDPRGLDAVIALAHEKNPDYRSRAAYCLNHFNDPRACDALLELLHDSDVLTREDAAAGIVHFGDARAIAPLVDAVKAQTDKPYPRADFFLSHYAQARTPAEALGSIHDPRAFPALMELARDTHAEIRMRAAQGLAATRLPEAVAPLQGLLRDADPAAHEIAAEALGILRDDRATALLLDLIKSPDANLRSGAALGLGHSRDPRAFEPLKALAEDADALVRGSAAMGLALLGDTRGTAILALLIKDADANVDNYAARALSTIRDPQAADVLISCLHDPNPEVVKSAEMAIHFCDDPRARHYSFQLMMKGVKFPWQNKKDAESEKKPPQKDEF